MSTQWSRVPEVERAPAEAVVWAPYWRSHRLFRIGVIGCLLSWLAAAAGYWLIGDYALIGGGALFLVFWACGMTGTLDHWRFRCPACGKRFGVTLLWSGWPRQCYHCGLARGPTGVDLPRYRSNG